MRCNSCHEFLALELGGDLDEQERLAVQRHLAECPDCRDHYRRLTQSQAALQLAAAEAPLPSQASLWPRLAQLIQPVTQAPTLVRRSANRFNGWIPALAMGVACLLILSFSGRQNREMAQTQPLELQPLLTSPAHATSPAVYSPALRPGGSNYQPEIPVWDASLYTRPANHPLQDDPRFLFIQP